MQLETTEERKFCSDLTNTIRDLTKSIYRIEVYSAASLREKALTKHLQPMQNLKDMVLSPKHDHAIMLNPSDILNEDKLHDI